MGNFLIKCQNKINFSVYCTIDDADFSYLCPITLHDINTVSCTIKYYGMYVNSNSNSNYSDNTE